MAEQLELFPAEQKEKMASARRTKKFTDYDGFVEKFKPKKTTDDCYTPEPVYEAVADYVAETYHLDRSKFVRPFFPGGDYQKYEYPEGAVVVDNPPFSILSQIVLWYHEEGIPFFLFCGALTPFSSSSSEVASFLNLGIGITYENGATVSTSFVTNLEDPEIRCKSEPRLYRLLDEANRKAIKDRKKPELPKYKYPANLIYAPEINLFSKLGIPFQLSKADSFRISNLDSQRSAKKTLFGGGFLISEKARIEAEKARIEAEKARIEAEKARIEAEKARIEAEKARPATVWELSEREINIIKNLGN